MIKIIDNALPLEVCRFLHREVLNMPMFLHSSIEVNNFKSIFFASEFNLNDFFTKFICEELIKNVSLKKIHVLRCYANIHFQNQSGEWHQDDGDLTFVWMISPTLKSGDGCFEIKNGSKIDFVNNRLIIFDAKTLHRGNHSIEIFPRITIALKTQAIE